MTVELTFQMHVDMKKVESNLKAILKRDGKSDDELDTDYIVSVLEEIIDDAVVLSPHTESERMVIHKPDGTKRILKPLSEDDEPLIKAEGSE